MKYFFEISYNGANYHGWQIQKNATSVQEVLTDGLTTFFKQKISIVGSGRTDAGVHARQQFFNVNIDVDFDIESTIFKLNSFLPREISINAIRAVRSDVSARFNASSRSYEYHMHTFKKPFLDGLSYYFWNKINVDRMNEAAAILLTKTNFQAFSKVKTETSTFLCDITAAKWIQEEYLLVFHISANRFLRGMVRTVVGTLLDVGLGKTTLKEFEEIIESKDRRNAGRSVPACGLYLSKVEYPAAVFL